MPSEPLLRVGFVGVGTMGMPMLGCLVRAGIKPEILDSDHTVARTVARNFGLSRAADPAGLGQRSDVVILMLPNSAIVRMVCLGREPSAPGLAETLKSGAIVVDMSSSDPGETRRLGRELSKGGITLIDAPVSGGVRKARTGSLSILLGSDSADASARVAHLLKAMGTVYPTGGLGTGHAAKALNNYVSAAGLAAACEAVIVGQAFGLDPDTLVRVLNVSTGRNNSTENKVSQFILSGEFSRAGFAMDLMAKDVGIAAGLGQEVGRTLPGLKAAALLWQAASAALGPGADHTEIFRYLNSDGVLDDA